MFRTTTIPTQGAAAKPIYNPRNKGFPQQGERVALRTVAPRSFAWKLAILFIAGSISTLGIASTEYPLRFAFQFAVAALMAHATELVHQCLHRTAIGSRRWDTFLGCLLALPSATSFHYYRWFHLWHHRYNGTEFDKESFDYAYQLMGHHSRRKRLIGLARHLSMVSHYTNVLKRVVLALQGRLAGELILLHPEMKLSAARQIQQDYQLMGGLVIAVFALSLFLHTSIVFSFWLLPLVLGWGPIHALIELPEHWQCDRPEANVFLNTRSIEASSFACWFTNNNCNHVAHHFDMSIPLERLPRFEKSLAKTYYFKYHERSYASFYLQFFKYLWIGVESKPVGASKPRATTIN